MRNSLPFLLLLVLPLQSIFAQVENKPIREKLSQPVYVVLDEAYGETYNNLIRDLLEKHWTLSGYTFIEEAEVSELKLDVNNTFLFLVHKEGIDADVRAYQDVITLANYARAGRYRNNITGAAIDLDDAGSAKMSLLVALQLIQDKVRFEIAKQEGEAQDYEDFVADRRSRLKEKLLCISRGSVELESTELSKIYPHRFDLMSTKELVAVMESKPADAAYAYVHGYKIPGGYVVVKTILDAGTGEVLYFATSGGTSSEGQLNKKDWKALE